MGRNPISIGGPHPGPRPGSHFATAACLLVALLYSGHAPGWGADAHGAIGVLALERIGEGTRVHLGALVESLDAGHIAGLCNWPDAYRETPEGEWSAPLHYVNVEFGARSYDPARDCPGGQCLPAAIKRFALLLGDRQAEPDERREAFAFLCHFTGDLHQPLHVGFAEDRGGNLRPVVRNGIESDLHTFWDSELIAERAGSRNRLLDIIRNRSAHPPKRPWNPADVEAWANETHTFTRNFAYPEGLEIDAAFEARSWRVMRQQIDTAATRLASVLDAVLADEPAADAPAGDR